MFGTKSMVTNKAVRVYVNTNKTDLNLFALAGNPTAAKRYLFVIASGVVIGQVSAAAALTVGQFPAGTHIEIHNAGSIQGRSGAAGTGGAGGGGGDAIKADYLNQTVVFKNLSGGQVLAGGGGGGRGGTGGTGGQGSYQAWSADQYQQSGNLYVWWYTNQRTYGYWGGAQVVNVANNPGLTQSGNYRRGAYHHTDTGGDDYRYYYAIQQLQTIITNGGAGGAGGSGGRGQGYNAAAAGGSGGAAGANGGTNAGKGGTGGTGGTGGAWGAAGNTGNTGGTGASGNYSGGSSGAGGSGGGARGRYLVKGAANVTFTNAGTIAGGTA